MLLEELCNACGVSGDEGEVRKIILNEVKPCADEITIDSMGNLICLKKGDSHEKKVMISAHMDEVGFIVSGVTDKGYLEFKTVGGIDTRVIISKKVCVGKNKIPGVIGMKAIHLQSKTEREEVPKVKSLFIDIGAKDKEDALKYVDLGDYACFATKYGEVGENAIKAKAIDDRAGCYILTELIKKPVKYDTYFCFTVQEEVGLRGAKVAAYRIMPDIALVIESTTCADVHNSPTEKSVTDMGGGAALSFMDSSTIVNREYVEFLKRISNGIAVQYKKTTMGGNDAGAIHKTGAGIRTASVSVPCRYLHSPVGVCAKADIEAVKKLAEKFLERIDEVI